MNTNCGPYWGALLGVTDLVRDWIIHACDLQVVAGRWRDNELD